MANTLAGLVKNYLVDHNVMTLATLGSGGVWAAAVFYVNDGFNFYFLSAETTRHSKNISNCAEVSATIQKDYDHWKDIKGVQMEGAVTPLRGAEKAKAMALYGIKFPVVNATLDYASDISRALSNIAWYKLVPRRLYFIDNAKGLGHRDEIDLSRY